VFFDWINCFIELQGMHRFKQDLPYGRLLCGVRDGNCTKEDIIHLNKRLVVNGKTQDGQSIPMHIWYGTFRNRERDAIKAGLFHKQCVERWRRFQNLDDSLLIFCSNLQVRNGKRVYTDFKGSTSFWKNCSEDDLILKHGRVDPLLCLDVRCSVMLTNNICVANGLANGSQAVVKKLF